MQALRYFDADATRERLPYPALIEALRGAFVRGCEVPPRHVHAIAAQRGEGAEPAEPAGSVLLMPAWRVGGRLGIKTVNVFPGNAARGLPALHAVYTLFDASTGVPLAQLDGGELTTRRTVAASALAASYLAREDAEHLLIVGAGRLASEIAEAMRVVRPRLSRVTVWARRAEAASALAARLSQRGFEAAARSGAAALEAATREAQIVSCATLATEPLIRGARLAPGCHLDLMGAFTPAMRECDGEAVRRARVFVDTAEALAKAGDLAQAAAEGAFGAGALQGTLAELCRGECSGRSGRSGRDHAAEITLFKSVGTALEDLAAAELAFDSSPTPLMKILLIVLAVLAALAGVYFWAVLSWSYSSGERAGWVQKLSKKGWLCKTWEGELAMVAMPGAAPEKFFFTITDERVAGEVNRLMGKRASLHYEEKVGLPTSCFGETRHFVTRIRLAEDIIVVPGTMPQATVVPPAPAPTPPSAPPPAAAASAPR